MGEGGCGDNGGSGGIGKLVVGLLAEMGVKVAVVDVQEPTFEGIYTCWEDGWRMDWVGEYHANMQKNSAAHGILRVRPHLSQRHCRNGDGNPHSAGNPTVLINNAGVARGNTILASTEQDIKLTFQVNTLAHCFMTQEFLPSMVTHYHGR